MKTPLPHRLAALTLAMFCAGAAQAAALEYLGQQIVPSGTLYAGTLVGGLSGMDRDTRTGRYLAISDDRSAANPARFYELSLDLGQFVRSATPGSAGVMFLGVTTVQQAGGGAFATNTVDPESLRINPGNGKLVWSNEGQRGGAGVPALQNPTVREMDSTGAYVRDFAVPTHYNPAGLGATDPGIRNNLAFESLAVSTDGRTLYTATENALVQDGTASSVSSGSPSRILSFDLAIGVAGGEYVYQVDPVALPPLGNGFATNGLVELLATGPGQFIAVERSFAAGAATPGVGPNGLPTGNTIRLYQVDLRGATDVSGLESLQGASFTPVSKTLLLDLSTLQHDDGSLLALDNIEGITWGADFNGKRTLILVSDNNFAGSQFTQFVALSVTTPVPEPGTLAFMLAGLSGLGAAGLKRRR
ncbi:MAG: esterase-like activity of phytase family protein [Rubrivivax sp.]|nr:esterase-like activity of phytase family protein [Rubrivivax sp.]